MGSLISAAKRRLQVTASTRYEGINAAKSGSVTRSASWPLPDTPCADDMFLHGFGIAAIGE